MTADPLAEAVAGGARRALAAYDGEELAGFALCTDDDLRSLSAVGCTRAFLATGGAELLFFPTEWPEDDDTDHCEAAWRILWERADATDDTTFGDHVASSFQVLVDVLLQFRLDGTVGEDVFLVVLSTDPSEPLTALEGGAVRALNPPGVHARWLTATAP